ncbi:MAG: T9SS type A sorting domain-containing protein [Bacteroidota bacterium]|nr:T9SS type A sorting domain-containing protein [Bacteroidota bacterium]
MKKLIQCFFSFLFLFLFTSVQIFSLGFNSIHSPDGINIIAVGNEGRLYRSSNSGDTWASYTLNTDNFRSVFSFGNDVWIAGDNGNIYKTQKTNSPVSTYNVGASFSINSIFFSSAGTGYLCGDAGNIYKTINGGLDWTPVNTGIPVVKLNSISFIDDMKGIVVGENGVAYLTDNSGSSWTLQTTGTSRNLLKAKYFAEGINVVGEYGTILTKENSGSWTPVITRTTSDIRGISGTAFNNTHVCGGGGFIRNNSNGSSNFFNFEINPMLANLVDIFYYNSTLGFAVSSLNFAIIRTTNGGVSWDLPAGTSVNMNWVLKSPSGSGIGNNLCPHPKDRNSAFVVYGNKVYVSRDRSETWTQISTISIGSRAHSFYVSPVDTNIWLAAMESSPDIVVRSTDYGITWTSIIAYNFSTYGQPLEMDQNNPSVFYFAPSNGSGLGVFKSTDDGATFALTAPYNNSSINQPCDLIVMWDSSNVLYMGDDGADIFKSTDFGVSWAMVKPGSSSEIPSMCNSVFDQKICYATTWSSSQVYKTLNYGDNWSVTSSNSGSGWGSDVCREDPTVVLTGNYGSQSYLSTNAGSSFTSVNSGLNGAGAGIMVPDRGIFLNMQTGSLYKLNIIYGTLTNTNENTISAIPSSFELYQNYPNPFNPTTNIKFSLPNSGNISLKVYNQLGKEVRTLSEGFRAAGTYEISFDATALTSGIYFYKLLTNELTNTKKMLLIK